jgi:hypothetical protein
MDSVKFFLTKRLKSYKKNFLLVQALAPKLGIYKLPLEIWLFRALINND